MSAPLTADERAEVQQELVDLEAQLEATLRIPPLDNDAARRKRIEYVQRSLGEIERLESLLGIKHLRVVA